MENKWRIEKRDGGVWAWPEFETQIYGIRIENTGEGYIESEPYWELEPEKFRWAEPVDEGEFKALSEKDWLALLEGWLADEQHDAAFAVRFYSMDSHERETEAVRVVNGNTNVFVRCVCAALRLNDQFMCAMQKRNAASFTGPFEEFGVIIKFDEKSVLEFSLWPLNKREEEAFSPIREQLQSLISWFAPSLDEEKVQRFTVLREYVYDGSGRPHQISIGYVPAPLSAHERMEEAKKLNDLLHSHFSPDQINTLIQLIAPSS